MVQIVWCLRPIFVKKVPTGLEKPEKPPEQGCSMDKADNFFL